MVVEQLDALRLRSLYEWAFAIIVANLSVQFFRLLAQFSTLIFDLLRLSYGIDLFWPLTTDDLRPYTHYFTSKNEILYKLLESLILTATAFYSARSLAEFSVVGLILVSLVFSLHSSLLVLGVIFADHTVKVISLEFLVWLATVCLEVLTILLIGVLLTIYASS